VAKKEAEKQEEDAKSLLTPETIDGPSSMASSISPDTVRSTSESGELDIAELIAKWTREAASESPINGRRMSAKERFLTSLEAHQTIEEESMSKYFN